jgi:hypothetical protein
MPTSDAESEAAVELYRPPKDAPLATTDALPSFSSIVEAVRGGQLSADSVEKLLAVYRELKADKAEEAYNMAFKAFQEQCPKIPRNRKADIVTKQGGRIKYTYADIEMTMETIGPVLAKHGLSVSFDDSTIEGNMLTAACRCSHVGGHSRVSKFTCTTDTTAGMSPQQKAGNAATYAQRRALNQRLGLTTGDPDHDGGEPPAPSPLLTEQQRQHIADLCGEVGQNWDDLVRWWQVPNFADATQDKYAAAVKFLEQKKQQQTKGKPWPQAM